MKLPHHPTLLALVCILSAAIFPCIASSQSTFPSTRNGIHIFYDQPPWVLTEHQIDFLVRHYVGCQKIPRTLVDRIKARRSDFLVLAYRLAFGTYDNSIAGYVSGNDWIKDWDFVSTRNDWFITDPSSTHTGGRVRQRDWNWYLMDISGEVNGNTSDGWKEYWTRTVLEQLRDTDCDGVFADSFGIPWNLDPTPVWLQPPMDIAWIAHMQSFATHVRSVLTAPGNNYAFIPNVGPWITTRDDCDYADIADGVMVEMFASPGPWDLYDLEDWQLQMNRILDLQHRGKILICQPITEDEWAVDERLYNLASYLLIKGEHSYYNLVFGENFYGRLIFFPECTIDLGEFTEELPNSIDACYDDVDGVYRRDYENGIVIVNPTWEEREVVFDGEMFRIDRAALRDNPLIDVPEDGVYLDRVRYEPVSGTVAVGAKGGEILLRSIPLDVERSMAMPDDAQVRILGNAPNPFAVFTEITYRVEIAGSFVITLHDVLGRIVRRWHLPSRAAGVHMLHWNGTDEAGRNVPAGTYLLTISGDDATKINNRRLHTMTVLR